MANLQGVEGAQAVESVRGNLRDLVVAQVSAGKDRLKLEGTAASRLPATEAAARV